MRFVHLDITGPRIPLAVVRRARVPQEPRTLPLHVLSMMGSYSVYANQVSLFHDPYSITEYTVICFSYEHFF